MHNIRVPRWLNHSSLLHSFMLINYIAAVASKWQEWGQWSECSVSCGQGSKLRARTCSGALFGGNQNCPGHSTESGVCDITKWTCGRCQYFGHPSPIMTSLNYLAYYIAETAAEWQGWGPWSECSASCGPGTWLRARACGRPLFGGSEHCPGSSTETGICEIAECPGMFLF